MVAFYARRPPLRLEISEDAVALAASVKRKYERQVTNDALYLPQSTNMGLPAYMSTGEKYNYEDADEGIPRAPTAQPPTKTSTFKRSIPCFYVSHVPSVLPWYKEVLGFSIIGKVEAGRAELHRAAPGVDPKNAKLDEGVSLYLRRPADPAAPMPVNSMWIEVDDVDSLHQEILHQRSKYAQDLSDYFPKHHFGGAKVQSKPRNTGFGERQMVCVDDAGNTITFFQVLNQ